MFSEGDDYVPALWRIPFPDFLAAPTIGIYMWLVQWGSEYDYIHPESGNPNFFPQALRGTRDGIIPEYLHLWKGKADIVAEDHIIDLKTTSSMRAATIWRWNSIRPLPLQKMMIASPYIHRRNVRITCTAR